MHIGLIGGIGPAATLYYYRKLTRRAAEADHRLELTVAHAQFSDLFNGIVSNDPESVAQIFAALGRRLEAAGAERMAITSMGGHFCTEALIPITPLPLINAIQTVPAALLEIGYQRIGLIGTAVVMNSRLYGGLTAQDVIVPEEPYFNRVNDAYFDMAEAGVATGEQRDCFFSVGRDLCERGGADVVLLGGTDLFLAFEGVDPGFPVIDSADLHIDAIFEAASPSGDPDNI